MKVVIVSPYFYPEGGGLEKYAYEMAKELSKKNDVIVICSTKAKDGYEVKNGIRIIRKKPNIILSNTPIRLFLPFELLTLVKKEDPDLIIAHTPVPFFVDIASLIAKLLKKPAVIIYHTGELKKDSWIDILAEFYEKTVERITLRGTRIISVSHYVQKLLWKKGFYSEVKYPKIDDELFFTPHTFKRRENIILFVGQLGRFHKWKNLKLLLNALVLVKKEVPNIKLIVIGHGDLIDHYKRLAQNLYLDNNVEFRGYVTKKDLIDSYKSAKILVLPSSKSEAFGVVVVEALTLGTPVVVSEAGEFPTLVEDMKSGILTKLNKRDLADKILFLLENEKMRRKMGIIGRRTIKRFK